MMKIVIVGASGFVGQQVIPLLERKDVELVLTGRDPEKLRQLFPGATVCGHDDLVSAASSADLFVNLAVVNNDSQATEAEFRAVNVTLMQELYAKAQAAGAKVFCQFSTFIVGRAPQATPYGKTKAEAEAWLGGRTELPVMIMRIAAVAGDTDFRGKLAVLNRLPAALRPTALNLLSALRPIVRPGDIADSLLWAARNQAHGTVFVSSRQIGNWVYGVGKFCLDIGFALAVLIVLWWLLLLAYIAVRFSSPGPGLFIQDRVGQNGAVFQCYKFRTMQVGTPQRGTHELRGTSLTPIGAFLRKTKIDELPQIINLLMRNMSLVGPRPCLPMQTLLVEERKRLGVLRVLPGITGLSQLRGIDMSTPVELAKSDAEYIALRTLPYDIKMIILTFLGKGFGDPAQRKDA
ncbi:sugar transferase [Hoeflea ulvae]|uniref:Sugar transferase n=1 Tax=Hoeflea ulvae TaxID=2983764 RepID=A0ABT3YAX6_9HYPH|nr:sugar transferase [Hoeflea ulvae]MCY0093036.1 sugar transferase [Hoeflea ulvae]